MSLQSNDDLVTGEPSILVYLPSLFRGPGSKQSDVRDSVSFKAFDNFEYELAASSLQEFVPRDYGNSVAVLVGGMRIMEDNPEIAGEPTSTHAIAGNYMKGKVKDPLSMLPKPKGGNAWKR